MMRPYSSRHKVNGTDRYARRTAGKDRMCKERHRATGQYREDPKGRRSTLSDVWPE